MTSRLAELRRGVAAVGDEDARHRLDAERQQAGDRAGHRERRRSTRWLSAQQQQPRQRGDDDQHLLRRAACRARRSAAGWPSASRRSRRACSRRRRRRPAAPDRSSRDATDASASGKLAPHRMAPAAPRTAQRTRSSWNWNQAFGAIDGLTGQYGSDSVRIYDVHAIAAHSASWHQAERDPRPRRASAPSAAPTLLPRPRPSRNTARISEKV